MNSRKMDSHHNDSENSEKSEPGSKITLTSNPPFDSDRIPLSNDGIEPQSNRPFNRPPWHQEHKYTSPYRSSFPIRDAPALDILDELKLCRERIPPRINSSPNLTNNTVPRHHFETGLRHRMSQLRTRPDVDMKHADDTLLMTSVARPAMRAQPAQPVNVREPHPQVRGGVVLGLISRLTSLMTSRTLDPLDEQVLNNFNIEVGTVTSRVDMWRQRLEEERTNSVPSYSLSFDAGSPRRSTTATHTQAFITGEIYNLVQLTRDLATSLSGRLTGWGWLGIEDKLLLLLEMGSNMVFPLAEIIIMSLWRMLREIFDQQGDDTEKSGGMNSVVEAINNAFYAIRSLIHLGKAYQNAHEQSDSDYTGEDSRPALARSLPNFDQKP